MRGISFTPEKASTFAHDVDSIYLALCIMSFFIVGAIFAILTYFLIRYRRSNQAHKPPKTITRTWLEISWCLIPLGVGIAFFSWGASAYLNMYQNPPSDAYEVFVTAKQWMWKFQHPEGNREINELHVPLDRPVKLVMISQDVVHSFYVPAFRVKHDVLPMRYTQTWFQATKIGIYHLFCAEYCGTSHSHMKGKVIVQRQSEFNRWLQVGRSEGSPSFEGAALIEDLGCRACHNKQGTTLAPLFEGIYKSNVRLSTGSEVVVDENYIRESILNPSSKIVANYKPVMPSYAGRITEEELNAIVAYIKSLSEEK